MLKKFIVVVLLLLPECFFASRAEKRVVIGSAGVLPFVISRQSRYTWRLKASSVQSARQRKAQFHGLGGSMVLTPCPVKQ
jgi:hypothetical protein